MPMLPTCITRKLDFKIHKTGFQIQVLAGEQSYEHLFQFGIGSSLPSPANPQVDKDRFSGLTIRTVHAWLA